MANNYEKFFQNSPEPPDGLFEKVIDRLEKEQRFLMVKRRLMVFSAGLVGSLVALIPAFRALQAGLYESGFINFFSLLFSDFQIVANYWQGFAISLLESLPVMSLAIFLAVVLFFLVLLKFFAKDLKTIHSLKLKYGF